jgi:hypothetical protein
LFIIKIILIFNNIYFIIKLNNKLNYNLYFIIF